MTKRTGFTRALAAVTTAATVATLGTLVAPTTAAVAAGTIDCSGDTSHANRTSAEARVREGASRTANSGPYEDCTVRFNPGTGKVDLHCWVKNGYNNYWWFIDSNTTATVGKQGWVWEWDFDFTPDRHTWDECGGAVQPIP